MSINSKEDILINQINSGIININSLNEADRKAVFKRSFLISEGLLEFSVEEEENSCGYMNSDDDCLCHHCRNS